MLYYRTSWFHLLETLTDHTSYLERKNSQTGDLQTGLSRFERGIKTSEPGVEISVSPVTLEVDEVQPSAKGVIDSEEDDDGDGEAINTINNTKNFALVQP